MEQVDVVVIGAGLSGLVAARELHRRGVDVLVLESADRPGGRALTETTALGSRVDLGGQWIGHGHHRITALAAELGATPFRMHTGTLPTVLDGGRALPAAAPPVLVAGLALAGIELLSRTGVPRRAGDRTLRSLLDRVPGRTARRLLEVALSAAWTADPDRFSVRAMTRMVRSQGGLRAALGTRGGAQDTLLVEGMGALVDGLAAGLGERLRLGERVVAVTDDGTGVTVHTATGPGSGTVRAGRVVVTAPPPTAARIRFDPPLPPERAALGTDLYMGSVHKAIAVYERPFWRDRTSAELLVLDPPGRAVFDSGPPDGPGHLCVLVAGPAAREIDGLDPAERRERLLGPLAAHLGGQVREPVGWHEKSWHLDEHAGGGYLALPLPGTTDGFPPVPSAPVGNVHWAGSETSAEHPGYLEGAVAAGLRVADELHDHRPGA